MTVPPPSLEQDLKTLQKELMAWPTAQRYLNNHSVEELVLKYFQSIYGDDVACVNIIPSQSVRGLPQCLPPGTQI